MVTLTDNLVKRSPNNSFLNLPQQIAVLGNVIGLAYLHLTEMGDPLFMGDKLEIVDCLEILGTDRDLIRQWSDEKTNLIRQGVEPLIPSKYQWPTGKGLETAIAWTAMLEDLVNNLTAMSVTLVESDLLESLEKLANACEKESEFERLALILKPMAYPLQHKDWSNQIRKFERLIRDRQWEARKNGHRLISEDELRILVKTYIAEKDPYKRDSMLSAFYAKGISDKRLNALVNYETTASSTQRSTCLEPSDFRTLASEGKKWLIPSLMAATGVTLLTAPPGGFKTTFAFDLAGSVINGTSFMGEPIAENGPVLFACSDEPIEEAQERATMQGFIHTEDYKYIQDWNLGQLDLLEEKMADLRPKLVIVDSFDSIHRNSGHDENTVASSLAIKQLNDLAKKYSTQILIIHHENKDSKLSGVNKSRGSTAIVAAANAHIRLLPVPNESERVIVAIEKMRGSATRKILCDIDFHNVRFEPEVNLEYEQQTSQRDTILSFLKNNPECWFEVSELNQYLGWSGKGIYKPLKQLSSRGEIVSKPNPKGRKGMVYSLPCTDAKNDDQSLTSPPPNIEIKTKKNDDQTLIQQGLEDSHLLVTSRPSCHHLTVTPENLEIAETLISQDIHLVTFGKGTSEGGELDDQLQSETVPQLNSEETTTTANNSESQSIQPGDGVTYGGETVIFQSLAAKNLAIITTHHGDQYVALSELSQCTANDETVKQN